MDRSELTLVPEWLKSSASVTAGSSSNHQFSSSSLNSDDHPIPKHVRDGLSVSNSDYDIGRQFASDQATSSYFHQSSTNGSAHSRSYSSFGRSQHDWDWEDTNDYRGKNRLVLGDHRRRDSSDTLGTILPNRVEKDMLLHSQSMITGKCSDTWPRKVAGDSNNAKRKHSDANGLLGGGGSVSSSTKTAFEQDFPSLIAEERQGGSEIGRVSSSSLDTTIQNLPIGISSTIGCDSWKSALVEVPQISGCNSTDAALALQTLAAGSASVSPSTRTCLNMAETLANGPDHARTRPQLSVKTQRLDELAMKQSRQLIPMTFSMTKPLVPSPSEKSKPKIGQQQHSFSSSHFGNNSPHGGPAKSDVTKLSVGAGSASLRKFSNNLSAATADRRPTAFQTTMEKKPSTQVQSRNDFFKSLSRKNSPTKFPSAVSDPCQAALSSVSENADKLVKEAAAAAAAAASITLQDTEDAISSDDPVTDSLNDSRDEMTRNGSACDVFQKCLSNREQHSSPDVTLYPDEEEAAFLRSLGWEENAGEDEGLTEEEISAFYIEYMKLRPLSKLLHGMQPKSSLALTSQDGSCVGASSELSSSAA
ncbi:uncharacterized protein LOC126704577 isoform X3 [Quercus robur]|uniref:uncharacterized protein LOC126704577 isoform X3 n=1 Tax=Quercus robur TaxID=38942 RepID=UPI0021610FF3|nr:uncharacterized protein LOC126704577 isoform X3 [Quercus robur]